MLLGPWLLVFASVIFPSKSVCLRSYIKRATVFHHNIKNLKVCQKYSSTRHIFNSLFGVWYVMKHCVSCLIYYIISIVNATFISSCLAWPVSLAWPVQLQLHSIHGYREDKESVLYFFLSNFDKKFFAVTSKYFKRNIYVSSLKLLT